MKYINSAAFLALLTPVITLGSVSVLAEQTAPSVTQEDQGGARANQSDMNRSDQSRQEKMADRLGRKDQSRSENRGYIESVPRKGMQVGHLIGAEVSTQKDENVGPVNELIIDEDGQIVAVVVSVGGFLGMGEKEVAIGWDDVSIMGQPDEPKLRIDATRENLLSAPEFEVDK